jgi:hypothetical protein
MYAAVLLVATASMSEAGGSSTIVYPDDPSWYFTDYNWATDSNRGKFTANPGAYFKVGFTGTSFGLTVNTTTTPACKLGYQIDDGPWQFTVVPTSSNLSSTTMLLGTGLTLPVNLPFARTTHSIRCYLYASTSVDRWLGGGATGGSYWRVVSALLDAGAKLLPDASVHQARALVYGDSITEGVNAQLYDFSTAGCSRTGLNAAAAPMSWVSRVGEALAAEVSNAAFAAQGYITPNSLIYGNVPPLFPVASGGKEPASGRGAWALIDAAHSRLPAFQHRPPDYVINAEGFNDQVCDGWKGCV